MPLVGFRGALWVGDRGSVPRDRSVDGGAVLGSAETRVPPHKRLPCTRAGIGGRGHPVRRCRFLSRTTQNSALCVAGADCGLGGRVHAALMQGVVLSEN